VRHSRRERLEIEIRGIVWADVCDRSGRWHSSAIVAASKDLVTASLVQQLFNRPAFRVYASTDLLGVELGGALKNVIAIAAGIGDGLGFGDNSKAALVTRAISEIRRLGVACGAQADTFTGLSGLGDLMVTCFSRHSRNRGFGERVGRGEKPPPSPPTCKPSPKAIPPPAPPGNSPQTRRRHPRH